MTKSFPRIGYVPYNASLKMPGDRRRFIAYASARGLPFEIAQPDQRYDVVVLSELADITMWSDYSHGKIIYDLIDSYLTIPRTDIKQFLRGTVYYVAGRHHRLQFNYRASIQRMCRRADAVICTTDEQKRDILWLCPNVHIILDDHDPVVKTIKREYRADSPFNLVWEGLPSNIPQLKIIGPILRKLSRRKPLLLHIISDLNRPRFLNRFGTIESIEEARRFFDGVQLHRWEEATCSANITNCDVAIIPIDLNDPLTAGKPENKLFLFWRMAMPTVASATPAYARAFGAAGLSHLACRDDKDWLNSLEHLMSNETARGKAGARGYAFVEAQKSSACVLKHWDDVFASVGFQFHNNVP